MFGNCLRLILYNVHFLFALDQLETVLQDWACRCTDNCNFSGTLCDDTCDYVSEVYGVQCRSNLSEIARFDHIGCLRNSSFIVIEFQNTSLAHCNENENPYENAWIVDLGKTYKIESITLYSQHGLERCTKDVTLSVQNTSCKIRLQNIRNKEYNVTCNVNGKTIQVQKDKLTLSEMANVNEPKRVCEFQVWVCEMRSDNKSCNYMCPECTYCNIISGQCRKGCKKGYYGRICDKKCLNCEEDECDQEGKCLKGCSDGYSGTNCDYRCSTCFENECDQNGICKQGCDTGYYGTTCKQKCPKCFHSLCNSLDGKCQSGCKIGWRGDYCNESCQPFHFGLNCNEECNNCLEINNKTCKVNGFCVYGCKVGWYGDNCSLTGINTAQSLLETEEETTSIKGYFIGAFGGIILLAGAVILWTFRKWTTPKERERDDVSVTEVMTIKDPVDPGGVLIAVDVVKSKPTASQMLEESAESEISISETVNLVPVPEVIQEIPAARADSVESSTVQVNDESEGDEEFERDESKSIVN